MGPLFQLTPEQRLTLVESIVHADHPSLDAQQPSIVAPSTIPGLLEDMTELGDFNVGRGPEGQALRLRLGHILCGMGGTGDWQRVSVLFQSHKLTMPPPYVKSTRLRH
jgi:hypothetical protein